VTAFIFRCPTTKLHVQGWSEQDLNRATEDEVFELVACSACGARHLVNPKTSRLLFLDRNRPPKDGS
jgi:hypothetical protein